MREFECNDERITVRRGAVDLFLAAFGPYRARGERVICRHFGVSTIGSDPGATFPLSQYLGALAELQDQFGSPFMRKMGSFVFDKAAFPPGIDTVEKAIESLHEAYYMNHTEEARGRIGGYHWHPLAANRGRMVCDNPYPCAFDTGILESIARRFNAAATVAHEPGPCRHQGGDACSYAVEW